MGIQPLTVAAAAAALLVASVAADLAFDQRISLEVAPPGGAAQLVAEAPLDGRQAHAVAEPDAIEANATDTLTFTLALQNGYPWSSTKRFTLTRDGCYEGARTLAAVDVAAPARGVGEGSADVSVARLLGESAREPKPAADPVTGRQYAFLQVCLGERYVTSVSIPIEEVAR